MQRIAQEDFSADAHEAYKEATTNSPPVPIIHEREYLPMGKSRKEFILPADMAGIESRVNDGLSRHPQRFLILPVLTNVRLMRHQRLYSGR